MGSIRSLATITILGLVAAFLYVKINEAPQRDGAALTSEALPAGVPPLTSLSTPGIAPIDQNSAGSSEAPPWSASAAPTTPAAGAAADATPPSSPSTELPPVPSIPDMPDLPDLSTAPSPAASAAPPADLPANIPKAQYSNSTASPPEGISGRVPSLGTSTSDLTASPPPLDSMPAATSASAGADSGLVAVDPASLTGAPPTTRATPATPTAPATAAQRPSEDNRYGEDPSVAPSAADAIDNVGVSSFSSSWPVIQAALERGELARAHLLLSQWYDDPTLTPAEAQQVDTLLSQLAGTVVYSTEHQLEPAYVVRPNETLESIAQQYNVPWQLLAKINGISAANQVRPGQPLKVVRGPFSAVIELDRHQLTLMLDGRYAGKFPVDVPPDLALSDSEWIVSEKPTSPLQQSSPYGATMSAAPAVARSLRLRNATATDANPGPPITIGSQPAVEAAVMGVAGGPTSATVNTSPYLVRVSPRDADELVDILSVGSRIVIRR